MRGLNQRSHAKCAFCRHTRSAWSHRRETRHSSALACSSSALIKINRIFSTNSIRRTEAKAIPPGEPHSVTRCSTGLWDEISSIMHPQREQRMPLLARSIGGVLKIYFDKIRSFSFSIEAFRRRKNAIGNCFGFRLFLPHCRDQDEWTVQRNNMVTGQHVLFSVRHFHSLSLFRICPIDFFHFSNTSIVIRKHAGFTWWRRLPSEVSWTSWTIWG